MMNIAVIVYDGVELVDMNGPLDVFLHVNSIKKNRYNIYTVAEKKEPIKSEGGVVTILPTYNFIDCPEPDVLIVPGLHDKNLVPTTANDTSVSFITSICVRRK